MWCIHVVILLVTSAAIAESGFHPLSDEFIDQINREATTWRAGRNFDKNVTLSEIRRLLGVVKNPNRTPLPEKSYVSTRMIMPTNFDARKQWPNCPSIGKIVDQSACGSCWAVAATEVMTDRICVHSNGKKQTTVSSADLLSCCGSCGDGCEGGDPSAAWEYWVNEGIVSGGGYGSSEGCKSYYFPPCEHHVNGSLPPCGDTKPTPECKKTCDNKSIKYEQDLTYGLSAYSLRGDYKILHEILENGPVEASFTVYADFIHYKTGIYKYTEGKRLGEHSVKIIGWGEELAVPYWLVANSWNEDWGDKGLFKILRARNACNIEGDVAAGLPKL